MEKFEFVDLGLIDYRQAWDIQKQYVAELQKDTSRNVLIFCEHPTVITMGKNGSYDNLREPAEAISNKGIEIIDINRGGDVTLHNPGQLVGYPVFNLANYKQDLHWFLRELEECIMSVIGRFGLKGGRVEGLTGVWIDEARKICAMGLHCSRWVTSHGFALNVNNDTDEFGLIVPCGIEDKEVTSMKKEIGKVLDWEEVKNTALEEFRRYFS